MEVLDDMPLERAEDRSTIQSLYDQKFNMAMISMNHGFQTNFCFLVFNDYEYLDEQYKDAADLATRFSVALTSMRILSAGMFGSCLGDLPGRSPMMHDVSRDLLSRLLRILGAKWPH